jgi:2-amino-4-hydroxy-6-hydroxymethyldihydropteridine diphosphokinase/dihydropteroate synthase
MSVYLALGSNVGDRSKVLEEGLDLIRKISTIRKVSPPYETAVKTIHKIPSLAWTTPYLNLVVELEIPVEESPQSLLVKLKDIERRLGRANDQVWSPRPIDIDILLWKDHSITCPELTIPHPRLLERSFVLDPLKDLSPNLKLQGRTSLARARALPDHQASLMAIINLTPDSFSDGGTYNDLGQFENYLEKIESTVGYLDLGAESTRPGASPIEAVTEWERLAPYLEFLHKRYQRRSIRPKLSLDTRHLSTMQRAIDLGIDLINDVSGLNSPGVDALMKQSSCDFVLMHNLGVPLTSQKTLSPQEPPIVQLQEWFQSHLHTLLDSGVDLDRIIIDPGIGFGKTPAQNLEILANIEGLFNFDCRVLVGASRKSFLQVLNKSTAEYRDPMTHGLSHFLDQKGIDILRLHLPLAYHFERLTYQQLRSLHGCTIN